MTIFRSKVNLHKYKNHKTISLSQDRRGDVNGVGKNIGYCTAIPSRLMGFEVLIEIEGKRSSNQGMSICINSGTFSPICLKFHQWGWGERQRRRRLRRRRQQQQNSQKEKVSRKRSTLIKIDLSCKHISLIIELDFFIFKHTQYINLVDKIRRRRLRRRWRLVSCGVENGELSST